jgi:aminopeptidase N
MTRHDADPFNRWEAAQRLAVVAILDRLLGRASDAHAQLEAAASAVLADAGLDAAFKEQVLLLPTEGYLAEQLEVIDPQAVRAARQEARRALGAALAPQWRAVVEQTSARGPWRNDAAEAGRRALRGVALSYWAASGESDAVTRATADFGVADNMTDRLSALAALLIRGGEPRDHALARFETEFGDDPLVMDKWFSLQATMHRQPGEEPVLARVRRLMSHRAFSLRNPNKVRALIGAFCSGNLAEFHAENGEGYEFWAEQIEALDAINPHVAARMARALDRWKKFPAARQRLMHDALSRVAARQGLSADVREIVTKALEA